MDEYDNDSVANNPPQIQRISQKIYNINQSSKKYKKESPCSAEDNDSHSK